MRPGGLAPLLVWLGAICPASGQVPPAAGAYSCLSTLCLNGPTYNANWINHDLSLIHI